MYFSSLTGHIFKTFCILREYPVEIQTRWLNYQVVHFFIRAILQLLHKLTNEILNDGNFGGGSQI